MSGGGVRDLGAGGQGARGVCAANMGVGDSLYGHSTSPGWGGDRPISSS